MHKEAICQSTQWKREKDLLGDLHGFKTGEPQQTANILARQPVLVKIGFGEPERLPEAEGELPQAAVKIDNNAGAWCGNGFYLLEDALHIPQVVDQVGEDDDVEGLTD